MQKSKFFDTNYRRIGTLKTAKIIDKWW